ncbi:MAG TPA: DUF6458 family protein [Mycobacteriales bacterium]|jgi:hypothetical protein|nr:DUF6458 family protein [Mycobacteriales bacterium]
MGIGGGLFLVAVGAVLTWGVNATVSGMNIHTIGIILMIVGAVGVMLDLLLFAPRRRNTRVVSNGVGGTIVQDQNTYV